MEQSNETAVYAVSKSGAVYKISYNEEELKSDKKIANICVSNEEDEAFSLAVYLPNARYVYQFCDEEPNALHYCLAQNWLEDYSDINPMPEKEADLYQKFCSDFAGMKYEELVCVPDMPQNMEEAER